ncbi:MAG TPA: rRNA large subunit methyltransferase I [Firmicutes bacterium]|jgi:23S rRNA (cytosine1962-C5)-methyltransferase|nr:rRNA large subunit methyltransferase I [Bacillota bacterium]
MNQVILKAGKEKRIKAGHLWVYQGEIGIIGIGVKSGDVVETLDNRGRFLGLGYYNKASQIAVRLLTTNRETIDENFFRSRLQQVIEYRRRIKPEATSFRLVFGEADLLPGLIVDKFEDYLVVQFLTMGMEVNREVIIQLLAELCQPKGIIERSDLHVRHLEDLPERTGCIYGECPPSVEIRDNGLKFRVDLLEGQKTGYFLDQSSNRAILAKYAKGKRVLDCFCHVGSFAIHAASYGASSVLGVDISEDAVNMAIENATLNGLDNVCNFKVANVFDFLRDEVGRKAEYDLIILDPPAFTKSKQALEGAMRGYKEINLRALKLLKPGGILVTCSCSHHLTPDLFWEIMIAAAADNKKRLHLLERRTQGLDHPVLVGVPETEYLKCFVFEVM